MVIRNGQRVFAEIIEQYLKLIRYGSDGYASVIQVPATEERRWWQILAGRLALLCLNVAARESPTCLNAFGQVKPSVN